MSNIEMIYEAEQRLAPVVRYTPLLSSPFIDELAGRKVYVKAECLQHTGSFKFRGAWSALSALAEKQRQQGVIAYSSGNHAQAVAYAAKRYGISATIIMPHDAPQLKIDNTKALGAEVIIYDRLKESREDIGDKLSSERGLTLIKPYDNQHVIAGQGTTGLEIAKQATEAGVKSADVLVPCGGGGLTSGIALALAESAPDMKVHPCEPEGFDDVTRSLQEGERVKNPTMGGSLCDAIVTPMPGELTFPVMKELCGNGLIVSDAEALKAVALAFLRLKIVLEPGGAVALAAAVFKKNMLENDTVIVVASGGNVDPGTFQEALSSL